jgi:hypothetical protein
MARRDGPLVGTVHLVDYHRNGISGEGFHVVQFDGARGSDVEGRRFVAVVFDAPGHVSVLDREQLAVGDEAEHWRGDRFEPELRAHVRRWLGEEDTLGRWPDVV